MKKLLALFSLMFALCPPGWSQMQDSVIPGGAAVEAPAADENNPDFYLDLIGKMQQRRLYFASLAHLDAFDLRWPNDRRALHLRADALRQIGDFDRARAVYRRLLAQAPSARALHGQGLMAAAEQQLPEAVDNLRQASHLAPIDVRILNDLGYVELLLGQRHAARLSLHKAAELEPDNRQVGANLALYYLLEGQSERAERSFERYAFPEDQRAAIRRDALKLQAQPVPASQSGPTINSEKNVK